jgi:hypothetical protein
MNDYVLSTMGSDIIPVEVDGRTVTFHGPAGYTVEVEVAHLLSVMRDIAHDSNRVVTEAALEAGNVSESDRWTLINALNTAAQAVLESAHMMDKEADKQEAEAVAQSNAEHAATGVIVGAEVSSLRRVSESLRTSSNAYRALSSRIEQSEALNI